jgi:aspartate/methionine/tyrosine aminotransferase
VLNAARAHAGDNVIVMFPCYQSLMELAKFRGCHIIKWTFESQWTVGFPFRVSLFVCRSTVMHICSLLPHCILIC